MTEEAAGGGGKVPAVDTDVLVRLQEQTGDDDAELLKELVDVFAEDAKETCVRLAELAAQGPSEAISREAHRLKSGAANLGATRMTALCKELEFEGAREPTDTLSRLVARLTSEVPEAEAELRAYLEGVLSAATRAAV